MIPVVVIRPQPGCDATVKAARAMGLAAHGYPLFAVRPMDWNAPDPASFDALVIGSANTLRHGGSALAAYRGKPAYAVGRATADAASEAGLDLIGCGEGGLQSLVNALNPEHRRLLRLAGRENVILIPPSGISINERVVYASEPQPMPSALVDLLHQSAVVLLHSAGAAGHFAEQCDEHAISRDHLQLALLGPRIAETAGVGWQRIDTAAKPDDKALLALASQMCQNRVSANS